MYSEAHHLPQKSTITLKPRQNSRNKEVGTSTILKHQLHANSSVLNEFIVKKEYTKIISAVDLGHQGKISVSIKISSQSHSENPKKQTRMHMRTHYFL